MQTLVSVIISALMVVGSMFYVNETKPAPLGASQTISSLTAKTSIDDADTFAIVDNASTPTTKKITWGNATSSLETWFNGVYSPIFSASAGLASLLSDETGTSGGFVRAGSPTITTPTITTPTLDVTGVDATGDIYYNGGSGVLTRLGIGGGIGYYLRSSAGGVPEWSNTIVTFPYTASSTFLATTTWQSGVKTLGTNVFMQATAAQTITGQATPQPVWIATSTNTVWLTSAAGTASSTASSTFVGFSVSGASSGATTTIQLEGIVPGFSGLTRGMRYFAANTAGTISTTQGDNEVIVGTAISPTEIYLEKNPNGVWQFVGQATCDIADSSCTIPIPVAARFAIVKTNMSSTGCSGGNSASGGWTMTVAKVGASTVTNNGAPACGDGQTPSGNNTSTVSWGTSVLTITNNISGAGNSLTQIAYFYR
jgi:hypothetical protein